MTNMKDKMQVQNKLIMIGETTILLILTGFRSLNQGSLINNTDLAAQTSGREKGSSEFSFIHQNHEIKQLLYLALSNVLKSSAYISETKNKEVYVTKNNGDFSRKHHGNRPSTRMS